MNMVGVPETSSARRLFDFLFDFGLGGLAVDAGAEFDGIHTLGVLGPAQDLVLQVVGGDGFLMGEDVVVVFPEGVGVLLEDAAAGHGGGLGPRVQAFERIVLEVEAHLGGVVLDQVLAQHLGLALAVGALQVAEDDDGDGRAGGSEGGLELRLELVELGLEGVGGDVVEVALDDLLAVVGDVERDVLGLRALRDADADFFEAGQGARFGVADGHRELRLQQVEVTDIGFQRGFVEGGLLRGIGGAEQKGAQ